MSKEQNGNLLVVTCNFCGKKKHSHLSFIEEELNGWEWVAGIDCCPECLEKKDEEN